MKKERTKVDQSGLNRNMNKPLKITLISVSSLIKCAFVSFVLLMQIPTTTFHKSNYVDHSHFFREIMNENKNFANVPLTRIRMLASHDSMSNDINYQSFPNKSEDTMASNLFFRGLGKGFMVRISRGQKDNVYEQLMAGIRYIDFRITNIDGVFYTSHGLVSNTLETNLKLILKFLDENPGEFIMCDIVRYYPGSPAKSYNDLYEFIKSVKYNDKSLLDYVPTSYTRESKEIKIDSKTKFYDLTYNDLCPIDSSTNERKAGALIYTYQDNAEPFGRNDGNLKASRNAVTFNSGVVLNTIHEWIDYIKTWGGDDGNPNRWHYLNLNETQFQPQVNEIPDILLGWSLLHGAYHNNNYLYNEMIKDENKGLDWLEYMPIYMCDFSTCNENKFQQRITQKLINSNIKLAEYY